MYTKRDKRTTESKFYYYVKLHDLCNNNIHTYYFKFMSIHYEFITYIMLLNNLLLHIDTLNIKTAVIKRSKYVFIIKKNDVFFILNYRQH